MRQSRGRRAASSGRRAAWRPAPQLEHHHILPKQPLRGARDAGAAAAWEGAARADARPADKPNFRRDPARSGDGSGGAQPDPRRQTDQDHACVFCKDHAVLGSGRVRAGARGGAGRVRRRRRLRALRHPRPQGDAPQAARGVVVQLLATIICSSSAAGQNRVELLCRGPAAGFPAVRQSALPRRELRPRQVSHAFRRKLHNHP